MSTAARAAKHASGLYGRTFGLIRRGEAEVHHLHEVEQEGESGETPFIAILGLFLFLFPIFLVLLGIALAAYYLS
jgi:hypothetical protein